MAEGTEEHSRIMVFRPSLAEFEDFASYVGYMEKQGAHNYGIAKVNYVVYSEPFSLHSR